MSNFHNVEMERVVLGTLISDLPETLERLLPRLMKGIFYNEKHKKFLGAVLSLSEGGRPVDLLNLKEVLNMRVSRNDLLAIADETVPVCHAEDYVKTLQHLHCKRELETACSQILNSQNDKLTQGLEAILQRLRGTKDSLEEDLPLVTAQQILDSEDSQELTVEGLAPREVLRKYQDTQGSAKRLTRTCDAPALVFVSPGTLINPFYTFL